MQFSWHFCRKLGICYSPAFVCVCMRGCICVFAGCSNCSMHVVNRLSCVRLLVLAAPWLSASVATFHPPKLACCLLHLFPLLYLFGILFSLVFAFLCIFCCCTLRFSHLFGAGTTTANRSSTILPLPAAGLLVVAVAVAVGAGNDFNLLLTSLKFRNCYGNTQHDFNLSIGAHNYSRGVS